MASSQPERIGDYRVLRTLGRGGMGVVSEVADPTLPRTLALKQVLRGVASEQALERFLREANALARVQHRNVVRIHELGRAPGGPFIVQERVGGEPLDQVVARGPLDARRAGIIVRDVAAGVAAVHAEGILHRDLKPANVVLGDDGIPVLLDFGLARDVQAETLTRTGELLGTPSLMAPEQAEGVRDLDARVDVYGLGRPAPMPLGPPSLDPTAPPRAPGGWASSMRSPPASPPG